MVRGEGICFFPLCVVILCSSFSPVGFFLTSPCQFWAIRGSHFIGTYIALGWSSPVRGGERSLRPSFAHTLITVLFILGWCGEISLLFPLLASLSIPARFLCFFGGFPSFRFSFVLFFCLLVRFLFFFLFFCYDFDLCLLITTGSGLGAGLATRASYSIELLFFGLVVPIFLCHFFLVPCSPVMW